VLLTVGRLIPLRLGIITSTTIMSGGSSSTTYICDRFIAERKKALPEKEGDGRLIIGHPLAPTIDG
jgi:hypothetical protein